VSAIDAFLRRLASVLALALPLASSLACAESAAASPAHSTHAVDRLTALITQKQHRTPFEAKLDSNLLYALRAVLTRQLGTVDALPEFVDAFIDHNVEGADRMIAVTIRARVSADLLAMLAVAGGRNIESYASYQQLTATVPITSLWTLAQRDDVKSIAPLMPAAAEPTFAPEQKSSALSLTKNAAAVSGVKAHEADKVHAAGIDGTGVLVCVISDGIDSLPSRQASGAMPPIVTFGESGMGDHGTAMLEVVHAMAPGALLAFASALSEVQMANVIDGMRPAGCDIIVDDVVWPAESAYQRGTIAIAIEAFTSSGKTYISAAGDGGSAGHGTSGTWEGDFVDSGEQNAAIAAIESPAAKLHRFGAFGYNTLLNPPGVLTLKWSDPLGASANDYDLFVLDATGSTVLASSTTTQSGSQDPLEVITCTPSTCPVGARVVVALHSGAPRAIRLQAYGTTPAAKLAIATSGNASGHNADPSAITVAAIDVANAGGGAFTAGSNFHVENASADGDRHLFYTLGGAPITPGNLLFATGGGTSIAKVDIAAADGVATATSGYRPFFGTSAAAAHAAGIAALVKSANRAASSDIVRNALMTTALDIEEAGDDAASGAGIAMATAAVRSVLAPLALVTAPPASLQRAASRKAHGRAGVFDLPLKVVAGNPSVEPRQGPTATLVFTFDKAIIGASVAIAEGVATAALPVFDGNDVIVTLTGVADAQYVKVTLGNITSADGATGGSAAVRVGFLAGDVDGNRAVTLSDLIAINAALAQPVNGASYARDVNANGAVSLADLLLADGQLTRTLPPP
jgi:hypothetical protein